MNSSYRRIQKFCFSSLFAPSQRPVFWVPPIQCIYADFEYKVAKVGKESLLKTHVSGEGSSRGLWLQGLWKSHITGTGRAPVLTEVLVALKLIS